VIALWSRVIYIRKRVKGLNRAIVTTNAESEEKALGRADRGISAKVFTVRGNRGGIPGNRYEKPR